MAKRILLLITLLLAGACNLPLATQPVVADPVAASPAGLAPTLPPTYTPTVAPSPTATLLPTPTMEADLTALEQAAMRPEFAGDVALFPNSTRYWIEVAVDLDPQTQQAEISGLARIQFTNPLDHPLADLVLMLWPNDPQYQAEMSASLVVIGSQAIVPEIEAGGLAIRAALPEPLSPGEMLDVTVPFHVRDIGVMKASDPRRFGFTHGVLLAPTFYPLVPRLVDGTWQVEEAPPGGDTTNSDIAFYHVQVTSPQGVALATSGTEIDHRQNPDGTQTATFVTGPMRDFAMALGPLQMEQRIVDGILIKAWVLPEHASDSPRILAAATAQVRTLTARVGPYPYAELDLVDAPDAFGGIEYPGLVFIGTVGTENLIGPTVHEVGHQWFYGLLGNDQLHDPWMDEAAATYTEVLYYESTGGPERATTALSEYRQLVTSYALNPSSPIGLSVGDYFSEGEYGLIVYIKGALFFEALRREMGSPAFFDFFHSFFSAYRYGFVSPQDFQTTAEQTCSCDLTPLFDLWVYDGGPMPGP
jgi:hypothetical protein